MFNRSDVPATASYFLKPGYIFLPAQPTVVSTVLGSCVAVILWDKRRKVGGINHFQLPACRPSDQPTARFGDASTVMLIRMMVQDGSKKKHLEAQIFGGAYNREVSSQNVGQENVRVALRVLARHGIRVISEDVGGELGRKIIYDATLNEVAVLKVERLRKGDWHPYEGER